MLQNQAQPKGYATETNEMPIVTPIVENERFEYPYTAPEGKYIRKITIGGALQVLDSSLAHTIRIDSVTADTEIDICLGDLPNPIDPPIDGTVYYTSCSYWAEFEGNGTDSEFLVEHNKNTKKLRAEIYDAATGESVWASIVRLSENSVKVRMASPPEAGRKFEIVLEYLASTVGGCGCASGYTEVITGNGVANEFLILHELNTKRLAVAIYNEAEKQVFPTVIREDLDTIKVRFASAPPSGTQYEIVITK